MAKAQKRSGREPRKPKQDKAKAKVAASPFAAARGGEPAGPTPAGKK